MYQALLCIGWKNVGKDEQHSSKFHADEEKKERQ